MKKFASTWIIAAIVFAFVGYVYFYEYKGAEQRQEAELQAKRVIRGEAGDIVKVTFTKGDNVFVVQRSDNRWKVVAPVEDLGDADRLAEWTGKLGSESYQAEVTDKGQAIDDKVYGFDLPLGSISVEFASGKQETVVLGSRPAFGEAVYLKSSEVEPVILGNRTWRDLLITRLFELRDKELFRRDPSALEQISIKVTGQPTVTLVQEQGLWSLAEEADWVLDQTRVKSLVSDLISLRADDIVNEDKDSKASQKLYGGKNIQAKISVRLAGDNKDRPWTVAMTAPKDGKVFAWTGEQKPVYQIKDVDFKKLTFPQKYYRNLEVPFAFDPTPVARIDLALGNLLYRLNKSGDSWELEPKDEKLNVDQKKVADALSKLKSLRVSEYLDKGQKLNLVSPEAHLRLLDKDGRELYRLTWGDAKAPPKDKTLPPRKLASSSLAKDGFWIETKGLDGLALKDLVQTKSSAPVVGQTEDAKKSH